MNERLAVTAIVFSCDEGYFLLARGLVLSLAEAGYPNGDTRVVLIDIGCTPETVAWMKDRGVDVVSFDTALVPSKVMSVIKPVQRAQVIRPWLPDLLSQFDLFIWLDCDMWVQNGDLMNVIRAGAHIAADAVIVAPGNSHYNSTFYVELEHLFNMQRIWYESCYDAAFAKEAATKLHYSSGVFGMRRSSPVWALWRQEVEYLYPFLASRNIDLMHLAEQIALNVVIIRSGLLVRLDPLYNFHCNVAGAVRMANGRVVTNLMLPSREIGVIHLANWSIMRRYYMEMNLLYRSGEYLTPVERARISG